MSLVMDMTKNNREPRGELPLMLASCVRDANRAGDSMPAEAADEWPAEVEFIISALEAGRQSPTDRRIPGRVLYHEIAELRLFSDVAGAKPWVLYSRDATPRGLGFITRHRLPLGYGGVVCVRGPSGEELAVDCTLRRCRETVNGWFEGALSFNREQWAFDSDNIATRDYQPRLRLCRYKEAD